MPSSKPSGLPEYMYLRKGITMSDVRSNSIRTEDGRGQRASPKHANLSNLPRNGRAVNVQSDPESIQTEEYEQRFRSLMVKHVAGVPVKSFDQVTIASDLESVETGLVHQRFHEALQKGPEVRVFNEFGDQSDLDPMQMEEVERKFQAILKQKKMEKMRYSHQDGETDDEGTSDLDSVRAIPSKSEAGSPPNRQGTNGRSKGQRPHNGVHGKQTSRSRDASSSRASAYNSTRSSPLVSNSPVRSQLTSPWSTSRDVSPSLPQRSPTSAAVRPHFPFAQPPVSKPHGDREKWNAQRSEQASFPSWQDPSVGRQRAAAWNAQRQESFSTYEEVESLHSHQCSSLQSLDNSCGPSRLHSIGSTSSSLDQSLPQVDGEGPWNSGIMPTEDHLFDRQRDDQGSSLESDSTQSVSVDGGRTGHLRDKSRRSIIEDDEDEMNSSVAKWVDQTRAETARRRSHVGLPEDQLVRSHEAPEGGQPSCNLTKERSLTALNMQCGDVIPGRSGHQMRLPNETDLELALRVGNASPINIISRCASIDSNHSSTGSDHPHHEGDWTIAEDVLINLGFGGQSMGIPDRFLRSWREQALKQRVEEVQRLLGNSASNHLLQHVQTKSEKTYPLKEKKSSVRKEDQYNQNLMSTSSLPPKSTNSATAQPSESINSPKLEDVVMSRQRGADKSKLVGLRRSLKKAATVSSFGQTLAEISKQGLPNPQVIAIQQGAEAPPAARRSPGGGKYSPFHKTHKSSARDRRRKHMKKQSSLPISLETLQEEDESLKPGVVKSKPVEIESPASQKSLLRPQSLEVGDEPAFRCKLKIVMEQPSIESREAMSRQGTTDVDEAIADVDTDKKNHQVSMEQYLVVKAIIDSKDSGFENEPSRTGSPQISPRSSEDETVRGTSSKMITTTESSLRRTKSNEHAGSTTDRLLVIVPSKQINSSNGSDPSTLPRETFQTQLNKQEESPNRQRLPDRSVQSTPETSKPIDANPETEPDVAPEAGTKINGRSLSTSSERMGPSLADIQDDFHQTIIEDNDVFDSPMGSPNSESVSACCQTSPTLHSPLLSPLFFLGSISEHSDGISDSKNSQGDNTLEIFVMPGTSGVASNDKKVCGSSVERRDSLESIMTTEDGLMTELSLRNLSQEISDGGLSIIAEKEEEQGLCQEPSDQITVSDKAIQDNQELLSPLIKMNNKDSSLTQNLFKFDAQNQNSDTVSQTALSTMEKSRNPFKSSDSVYSSPRHSKVKFDFDATIEEDDDGEQYSDGESFSKVMFSEVTPVVYEASELVHSSDHKTDSVHNHENLNPFFPPPEVNYSSEIQSSKSVETEFGDNKDGMNNHSNTRNESVTSGNSSRLKEFDTGAQYIANYDFKENGLQKNSSCATIVNRQPIPEHNIPSKVEIEKAPSITILDENESENKLECSSSCLPDNLSSEGIHLENNLSKTNQLAKTTVPMVASGNESHFACEGESNIELATDKCQESSNNPDSSIPQGDNGDKLSIPDMENSLREWDEIQTASMMKGDFHPLVPTDKCTEFIDRLHGKRNPINEWKLGFDQPQIIRSTSLEAHLNFQRSKLRTLSERSTLYSDSMEPILSGFERVLTERSSTSTEGFGSFGSDVFRRPLTVMQTLQQVAVKLESHVRQRSLVSIQDEESEEDEQSSSDAQTLAKQACIEAKPCGEIDHVERKKAVHSKEKATNYPLEEDEGYIEVNSKAEDIVAVNPDEKTSTETCKGIKAIEKELLNNSNISDKNVHQDKSTLAYGDIVEKAVPSVLHSCLVVDTETTSPNIQVQEISNCKLSSKPDFPDVTTSSNEASINANKAVPKSANNLRRKRSWQFQASLGRIPSKFLSVPSFGCLTDSMEGKLFSDSSTAFPGPKQAKAESEMGEVQERVPVGKQNPNSIQSKILEDQGMAIEPEPSDENSIPPTIEREEACGFVGDQMANGKDLDGQYKSMNGSCLEIVTNDNEHENLSVNESMPPAEIKRMGQFISDRSSRFLSSSYDQIDDCKLKKDDNNLNTEQDENKNLSSSALLNPSNSIVSEVENDAEKLNPATDFIFVGFLPPNETQESVVVQSKFFRCEKFMNVSISSNGKVDFTEICDNDNGASRQIPTFLSEVQFFPRTHFLKKSTYLSSKDRMSDCSQTSISLDCPSPVPMPCLSPTFEDICAKAGSLILQLQDALASGAPVGFQRLAAELEKREEDVDEAEEGDEGEEDGEIRRDRAYPHSRDESKSDHQTFIVHHPYDPPRMKQGTKKRKKRPRDNGVKTSTPKMNPGSRHLDISSLKMDEEEGSSNDHLVTIRELLKTETQMRRKLDELESSFEEVSSRKQVALGDLKGLREAVYRNKRHIQKAEEIARESMERADGLRSELMVLEYQRDQARRDLEDLTQSIGAIHQSHRHIVSEEENAEMSNGVPGLFPREVIAVIKERDELKTRVRNGEGDLSPIERSELERQLNYTKQELFNGQKSSRAMVESLEEEVDVSRHRMEELLLEKTSLAEKVKELQAVINSEHGDLMYSHKEERNKLLEQLSGKLQKELDALRHQVHEKDQRLLALTTSASEKDKLNSALKEKIIEMQKEEAEEMREAERAVKEADGKARNADVVKELALVELREALLKEKEEEMEQLKLSLEKDKKEALAALDEKTSEVMVITQRSLSEKEEDLKAVKLQLVQHTEEANKMELQLKEQAEEQIKAAVDKERHEREEEYAKRRREENVEKELEVAKETSHLQGELHVARQRLEHVQTTVAVLKEELDKLREENLAAGREKVEAVSEAREKAREDIQRELDQLREQLAKENLLELDKLRMKLRQQDEELTKLSSEVKGHQEKEARSASVTGSKSILAEINEECKRTAAVIGTTPLKISLASIRGNKSLNGTLSPKSPLSSTPNSTYGPGRTQVMAALTNLRISNEELRNHVQSLKSDLERQKRAVSKAQKEKGEEMKKVANTIEKKSEDMDTMRDRLIQDHLAQVEELQQNLSRQRTAESSLQQCLLDKDSELREIQQSMTQWKEETALKMAKKFEEELGKELEIRLQETSKRDGSSYRGSQSDLRSRHSSDNVSPSTISSASDASTIRLLRHLQERVQQLRTENMSLRRSSRGPFESSGEERASPHASKSNGSDDKDHLLYQLQQRVKLLERQLQVAEERCRENAASVSEKTSENSRLQGALTQQTKELMKMERAYSKLATPPRTPVRL